MKNDKDKLDVSGIDFVMYRILFFFNSSIFFSFLFFLLLFSDLKDFLIGKGMCNNDESESEGGCSLQEVILERGGGGNKSLYTFFIFCTHFN